LPQPDISNCKHQKQKQDRAEATTAAAAAVAAAVTTHSQGVYSLLHSCMWLICCSSWLSCLVAFAAPNILAGLSSKGISNTQVGIYGTLGPAGFSTTIFASSTKSQLLPDMLLPTNTLLGVSSGSKICQTALKTSQLLFAQHGLTKIKCTCYQPLSSTEVGWRYKLAAQDLVKDAMQDRACSRRSQL